MLHLVQVSAKRRSQVLVVNFVTALACHFCLALPAGFTQPRAYLLASLTTDLVPALDVVDVVEVDDGDLGGRRPHLVAGVLCGLQTIIACIMVYVGHLISKF